MRKVLFLLCFLQSAIYAAPTSRYETRWDLRRYRVGAYTVTYAAGTNTNVDRAATARLAIQNAIAGDVIEFGPGVFDFSSVAVVCPNNVMLKGIGAGVTVLHCTGGIDLEGICFQLQNTTITNMTLECVPYNPSEDSVCLGFYAPTGQAEPYRATLKGCRIVGASNGVYEWSNHSNYLKLEDCEIYAGRQAVSALGSGGINSQHFELVRCKIDVDASRSEDIGHTSNFEHGGCFGVMACGGTVKVIDCEINLVGRQNQGPSWTPRMAGVCDTFVFGDNYEWPPYNPDTTPQIEIMNLRCKMQPNGIPTENCFDIEIHYLNFRKALRVSGGWGSGMGDKYGEFIRNW